jgi:hypothetical protein
LFGYSNFVIIFGYQINKKAMKKSAQIFAIVVLPILILFLIAKFDQKTGFGKMRENLESRK